jgi:hypothetical protein
MESSFCEELFEIPKDALVRWTGAEDGQSWQSNGARVRPNGRSPGPQLFIVENYSVNFFVAGHAISFRAFPRCPRGLFSEDVVGSSTGNLESFSPDVAKHVIRAVIIVFSLADHRKRNSILSGPKDLAEREPGEGKTNIVVRVNNLEKIAEDNRR